MPITHTIHAVFENKNSKIGYLYTSKANPNFYMENVKRKDVRKVCHLMNFLVERGQNGHPVLDLHTALSGGVKYVAKIITEWESATWKREFIYSECLLADPTVQIIWLIKFDDIATVNREMDERDKADAEKVKF